MTAAILARRYVLAIDATIETKSNRKSFTTTFFLVSEAPHGIYCCGHLFVYRLIIEHIMIHFSKLALRVLNCCDQSNKSALAK